MEELLERHFSGESLREVADERGCSHQTIATQLRDIKRDHITRLAGSLMVARKTGEMLWLAVPTTTGSELAPWLRYFAWVMEELEGLTFRTKITVKTFPDGFAFGFEEDPDAERGV